MKPDVMQIIRLLKKQYPGAKVALDFADPLELLVATILSAQCTDKRVNMVTPVLFGKYRSTLDYAKADIGKLEQEIRTTGFYHTKARNIINSAKIIAEKYGGRVPRTMQELTSLPGVARKTANVVLTGAYGIIAGIVVDTHVKRLSGRIGLSENEDPVKIEQDLMKITPREAWPLISNLLIFHGRNICKARTPLCARCVISRLCPKIGVST
jgi:endonuclease III